MPDAGISTSITTPTLRKCFMIWRGNLLFWSPYLLIPVAAFLLWAFNLRGHETTPKVALVSDSSIDAKDKPAVVQSVPTSDWQKQWTRMADSLSEIDIKLDKERLLNVQVQLPTPAMTTPSATPAPSVAPTRRGRRQCARRRMGQIFTLKRERNRGRVFIFHISLTNNSFYGFALNRIGVTQLIHENLHHSSLDARAINSSNLESNSFKTGDLFDFL